MLDGAHTDWTTKLPEYAQAQIALDPSFWQSLGKTLGWEKCAEGCEGDCKVGVWKKKARRFYDLILTGGDTEKFWDELLK